MDLRILSHRLSNLYRQRPTSFLIVDQIAMASKEIKLISIIYYTGDYLIEGLC